MILIVLSGFVDYFILYVCEVIPVKEMTDVLLSKQNEFP